MIKVLGENYFIDLDQVENYLDMSDEPSSDEETNKNTSEMKINVIKFELVKMLFETILTEQEMIDDKLGIKTTSNNTSVPFKIAFNTLLNKKLINHY